MKLKRRNNADLIDVDARDEPGVYVIANVLSEKVYIGSSHKLRNRLTTHLWLLREGRHKNKHLQSSWDKYGEGAFILAPLEYFPLDQLESREETLIAQHRAASYNIRLVPQSNRGFKHTAETRAVMAERAKVFTNTPEYRERVRQLKLGTKLSDEAKAKISAAKKGKQLSEEHRQAMRDALRKPIVRTAEHNAKIAATKAKAYVATAPDGTEHSFRNLREFCRRHGLQQSHMSKAARGLKLDHKGWRCRYGEPLPTLGFPGP